MPTHSAPPERFGDSRRIRISKPIAVAPRIIGAVVLALTIFLLHLPATHDNLLFDDAADYMRAAEAPLIATWLDTDSASPLALAHLRRTSAQFRQHSWDYLYAVGDNNALRHFHSPFSFYPNHIVHAIFGTDRAVRVLTSAVSAATCGILFLLLVEFAVPLVPAVLLTLYAGLGSRFVEVSVDPTPHGWFILLSLAFLYLFARYLSTHRERDLYAAAILLGLCFATLEFSVQFFLTIPSILLALWFLQPDSLPRWGIAQRHALRAAGIFLLTTFVVWPGGWFRGGYLITYGVLSATVLLHNKSAFGQHLTFGLVYDAVFRHHPILTIVFLFWIAAGILLLIRRGLTVPSIVVSTYTLFAFVLGLADHFKLNTYVSEFTIFLIAAAGLVLRDLVFEQPAKKRQRESPPTRDLVLTIASILLILGSIHEWRMRDDAWTTRPWLYAIFDGIRQQVPAGQTLLVTRNRQALSLYLPQYRFDPTASASSGQPRVPSRDRGVRYGLFDTPVPPPAHAAVLGIYSEPDNQTDTLWHLPPQ